MAKRLRRFCACAGGMLLLIGVVGCGGSSGVAGSLSGKVTYKGAAVTGGTITFHLPGDKTAGTDLNPQGNYGLQIPASGQTQVAIETESVSRTAPAAPAEGGAGPTYVRIPAKYADAKTSGLTFELKSGVQTKNFELTD